MISFQRKIIFCIALFLVVFPFSSHFFAGDVKGLSIETIDSKPYVRFKDFLNSTKGLRYQWNALRLEAEIIYHNKSVKIQLDAPYYISGSYQYPLDAAPVLYKNEIYLPRALVEELFTEFKLPLKYAFGDKRVDYKETPAIRGPLKVQLDFIVIDPGHGGKDPGAYSGKNLVEKKIVLDVGRYLYDYFKRAFPGTKIYITRYNDTFVTLKGRAKIANYKLQKDKFGIFISLHCNSSIVKRVHGYEIFYLAQNPTNEEARQLMMVENQYVSGEAYVGRLESYLLDSQLISESKVLAREMNKAFMVYLNGMVSSRGVRRADFAVLRGVLMPAILVEMGYISNRREGGVLRSSKFRKQVAKGLEEGVRRFMKNRPGM